MKRFMFKSLIVKISAMIVLVEAIALALLSFYYINRFSTEIDRQIETHTQMPGNLMNRQLLRYESVADKEVMTELVGEDFVDGLVIGVDQKVYYALNADDVRKDMTEIAWIDQKDFDLEMTETRIFRQTIDKENVLICITPIFAYEGAKPFFFSYIKVRLSQSDARKRLIAIFSLAGSLLCIILTSAVMIWFIRRVMLQPLRDLQENADHVANGNLEQAIRLHRDDELGSLAKSFAYMRDSIKQHISDLKEAEEKYRKIFENAVEGIFQLTPDGQLLRANMALANMLGYNSPEILYSSEISVLDSLFPGQDDRNSFIRLLETKEQILGFETRGIRRDGSTFWGAISAQTVHDEEGSVMSYEGALVDITESKINEQVELEKEKAQQEHRTARARSEFVTTVSQKTSELAKLSQSNIARMEESMRYMETASTSLSEKLQEINGKARNITSVVTTITKVADQTNLLSLNAAIEAEKAGEYGRGFAVVAQEIRRLADQTAVATLDIEEMVQKMQSAVSSGVLEIDQFIDQVHQSTEDVSRVSAQLTRIIEQVQQLTAEDTRTVKSEIVEFNRNKETQNFSHPNDKEEHDSSDLDLDEDLEEFKI